MGVRAAQNFAVEQAGQAHITAVHGSAGNLIDAIVADWTGADDAVFAIGGVFGIVFGGKGGHGAYGSFTKMGISHNCFVI